MLQIHKTAIKYAQICFAFLLCLLLIKQTKSVYATPDGWIYGQQAIYVNGQRFELWGYGHWEGFGFYRLRDIAYILNLTSAQFDIREPLDGYLHFWIAGDMPYTPIGTELGPHYEDYDERREIGGFHAYAVEHFPLQNVILSVDGLAYPDYSLVVPVLTSFGFPVNEPEWLADLEQVYFDLFMLSGLLGFSLEVIDDELHITTGTEYLSYILDFRPLYLLDISLRLTGHWVDRRFYDSVVITQEVVWPHEFEIGLFGLTYHPQFVDFGFTGIPLAARQPNIWNHDRILHPFVMEFLKIA